MPIDEKLKDKIILGRQVADKYRLDHLDLYKDAWSVKTISDHTLLTNNLIESVSKIGFLALEDFFMSNYLWNIQKLGFKSIDDFEEKGTKEDLEKLNQMWN